MTFITLAMLTALCLFIPVAMPCDALGAVTLLYLIPKQTLSRLVVLAFVRSRLQFTQPQDKTPRLLKTTYPKQSIWSPPETFGSKTLPMQ